MFSAAVAWTEPSRCGDLFRNFLNTQVVGRWGGGGERRVGEGAETTPSVLKINKNPKRAKSLKERFSVGLQNGKYLGRPYFQATNRQMNNY